MDHCQITWGLSKSCQIIPILIVIFLFNLRRNHKIQCDPTFLVTSCTKCLPFILWATTLTFHVLPMGHYSLVTLKTHWPGDMSFILWRPSFANPPQACSPRSCPLHFSHLPLGLSSHFFCCWSCILCLFLCPYVFVSFCRDKCIFSLTSIAWWQMFSCSKFCSF